MSSWLRRHVYNSIAFNDFSAEEIRVAAGQYYLRPAVRIKASERTFERQIPYEVIVGAFAFARVLALTG